MKNKKIIIAWISLIILFIMLIILNYIKFFGFYNSENNNHNNEIIEQNDSTDEAIKKALTDIINNFNADEEITKFKDQGMDIKATLKNHSIYISYITDTTTTYEFNYNNLTLNINVNNTEENLKKFNSIYKILIKAIQKRIQNESDINTIIDIHLNENVEVIGIDKTINNDESIITFKIDITKKIKLKEGE